MKLTTKDDIEAPIAFVFSQITDFAGLERQVLRQGVNLKRQSPGSAPTVGTIWDAAFPFRGKERQIRIEIARIEELHSVAFTAKSGGLGCETVVELTALSKTRSRLTLTCELKPTNLTSRLLVQSMKLAKASVTTRLQTRLSAYAQDVEGRFKAAR